MSKKFRFLFYILSMVCLSVAFYIKEIFFFFFGGSKETNTFWTTPLFFAFLTVGFLLAIVPRLFAPRSTLPKKNAKMSKKTKRYIIGGMFIILALAAFFAELTAAPLGAAGIGCIIIPVLFIFCLLYGFFGNFGIAMGGIFGLIGIAFIAIALFDEKSEISEF